MDYFELPKDPNATHDYTINGGKATAATLVEMQRNCIKVDGGGPVELNGHPCGYIWVDPEQSSKINRFLAFGKDPTTVFWFNWETSVINLQNRKTGCYLVRLTITFVHEDHDSAVICLLFDVEKHKQILQRVIDTGRICIMPNKPVANVWDELADVIAAKNHATLFFENDQKLTYKQVREILALVD